MRVRVEERTGERVEEEWAEGWPEVYLVFFVFSLTGVFGTHRVCAASWYFGASRFGCRWRKRIRCHDLERSHAELVLIARPPSVGALRANKNDNSKKIKKAVPIGMHNHGILGGIQGLRYH